MGTDLESNRANRAEGLLELGSVGLMLSSTCSMTFVRCLGLTQMNDRETKGAAESKGE
jgi:hypothetical protein